MRRTTSLTAAGLLGLALLAPAYAAGAAGETCQGRAATVVGSGHRVEGTEGPDVIVTNGAQTVFALGGDDLVCVSGPRTSPGLPVDVRAGDGNDVVDGTGSPKQPVYAYLGSGVDTFLGGKKNDSVEVAYPDVAGAVDSIRGGGGSDALGVQTGPGAAVIDNVAGRLTSAGEVRATWTGLEQFWIDHTPTTRPLTFVGSDADERIVDSAFDPTVVDVDLGRGDDSWWGGVAPSDGSRLVGGAGRDLLYLASEGAPLDLDLETGRLGIGTVTAYDLAVPGFEDADLFSEQVVLSGTDGVNDLGLTACTGTVSARGGDDEVERQYDAMFESDIRCEESLTISGGKGDDDLSGSRGADRLLGGKGRDRANGGQGRDTCSAERERSCER